MISHRATTGWRGVAALAIASAVFAANQAPPHIASAEPWPEADALFHRDPRWLGSDCAYSVDLGGGRVLWLFGDTFVATSEAHTRRASKMPRNTVALQRGSDPTKADIQFYWKVSAGPPASFFPDAGQEWFWPGGGIRLDDRLVIFLIKVRRTGDGMFGFAAVGTTAVAVDNPDESPDHWRLRSVPIPPNDFKLMTGGASVLRLGDHIVAYCSDDGGSTHSGFVARWPLTAFRRLDLSAPEWWDAAGQRWVAQRELAKRPTPLFGEAQTEFTVHHDERSGLFLEIQTRGFGGADLALRWSPALTGPWPSPQKFHRPPEAALPRVLIYAGKAHPELIGADLVVTYATNTDWERCLDDMKLYYPRFLRVTFARAPLTAR